MQELPAFKNPAKFLQTLAEQARIRLTYGPEFIGDLEAIPVGMTPRSLVYEETPHRLYHYPCATGNGTPLLMVYSLINRPYIFDLRPGRSLIEYLTQNGFDVYLLDWSDPTPEMGLVTLADLVAGTLRRCVRFILRRHKQPQLHLLGYCMGATFATLYAGMEPEKVSRLALLTPILGDDPDGTLQTIVHHQNLPTGLLDSQIISGRQLKLFFNAVRPAQVIKKERDFWQNFDQDNYLEHFLPVEKWSNDCPDVPGRAFQEVTDLCIKQNQLVKGPFHLGPHAINTHAITCPVLGVVAKHDWIIPQGSLETCAKALPNAQYTPYMLSGGHIGLVVGRAAGQLWGDLKAFLDTGSVPAKAV